MILTDQNEYEAAWGVMYESYDIMNRICWQGLLPKCQLKISRRLSPRTIAYAQNRGSRNYRIVFNAQYLLAMNDLNFLEVLAHEMIHLWQYASGRRGGHGRDFKSEQIRLGLIQDQIIALESPMGYVLFMHRLKNLHPAQAAQKLRTCS